MMKPGPNRMVEDAPTPAEDRPAIAADYKSDGPPPIDAVFSLSLRGTSGERAGERGSLLFTRGADCKNDGPPHPSPLLPPLRRAHSAASGREGRERASLANSSRWLRFRRGLAGWVVAISLGSAVAPASGEITTDSTNSVAPTHWSLQPLVKPALPKVKDKSWARTPIDRFVLAKLEERGLRPSPAADKRTLL